MKRTIKIIAFTTLAAIATLTAFGQQDKKAAEARKDMAKAKAKLGEAKIDSAADYQKFTNEAESKIKENQKEIAALKAERIKDTNEIKAKYNKEVIALERKNNDLKARMARADVTETSKWTTFKYDFNHEMNELGHSIKALAQRNKMK